MTMFRRWMNPEDRNSQRVRTSARKSGARSRVALDALEDRTLLSTLTLAGGVLTYTGAAAAINTLNITFNGPNVTFNDATDPITGAVPAGFSPAGPTVSGPFVGVTTLVVQLDGGVEPDTLNFNSTNGAAFSPDFVLSAAMGAGAATETVTINGSALPTTSNLFLNSLGGNDSFTLRNINGFLTVNNNPGADVVELSINSATTAGLPGGSVAFVQPVDLFDAQVDVSASLRAGFGSTLLGLPGAPSLNLQQNTTFFVAPGASIPNTPAIDFDIATPINGAFSQTFAGGGTIQLSQPATTVATAIAAGTTVVLNGQSTPDPFARGAFLGGPVTVDGILRGSSALPTSAPVTINPGGELFPGGASFPDGVLFFSSTVILSPGGTLRSDISPGAGTSVVITGAGGQINLGGSTLALDLNGPAAPGTFFDAVDSVFGNDILGAFANAPDGAVIAASNGQLFQIQYLDFTGNGAPDVIRALLVNDGTIKLALTSDANASVFGQNVTLTASLDFVVPGSVQFFVVSSNAAGVVITPNGIAPGRDGLSLGAPVPVDFFGQASISFSPNGIFTDATNPGLAPVGDYQVIAIFTAATPNPFMVESPALGLEQVVNQADTTVTITQTNDPVQVAETLTGLSAVIGIVAPGGGVPTGTVTFTFQGKAPLPAAITVPVTQVGGQFVATVAPANLPFFTIAGNYVITATYSGDTNFAGSVGFDTLQVNPVASNNPAYTLTLTAGAATSVFGQDSTPITATIGRPAGAPVPTGHVNLFMDNVLVGNAVLDATGVATGTLPSSTFPQVGTYTLQAVYGGDNNFESKYSATITYTVTKAATAFGAVTVVPPAGPVAAQDLITVSIPLLFTVNAGTEAPTGRVEFVTAGGVVVATDNIADGVATLSASARFFAQSGPLTARYAGDANYSAPANVAIVVPAIGEIATSTALTLSSSTGVVGQVITAVARVTVPGRTTPQATGLVVFTNAANVELGRATLINGVATANITLPATGDTAITATFDPANANTALAASAATQNVAVAVAATTTTLQVSTPSTSIDAIIGQLVAQVKALYPSTGIVPTGSVQFALAANPNVILGTVAIDAAGRAVLSGANFLPGTGLIPPAEQILATFIPTANSGFAGSSATAVNIPVAEGETVTTITFDFTAVTRGRGNARVVATVRDLFGNPITIGTVTFNGIGDSRAIALDGNGQAVLVTSVSTLGRRSISATYNGEDPFFKASRSSPVINAGTPPTTPRRPGIMPRQRLRAPLI